MLSAFPNWFAAIENAKRILKPGGKIVVVDFYVSRKHPGENTRHSWFTRTGWPTWFGFDNVFPSPDHVPYLQRNFETQRLIESRAKVPYLPLVRVPYYQFIGEKS
jgi:S-adenosylmethionine-diacylgycerolhomoserine-N-methlytransferase